MKKKGVSPVIATVLLIGIVITLALIIFVWSRGFVQESVTKFGGQNVELVCDQVEFDASYSAGTLSVVNNGNVPIYNMRIKKVSAGSQTTDSLKESSGDWPTYGLNPGDSMSDNTMNLGGYEEVTLIPILLGNSDNGKKAYTCDENVGYEIV